MRQNVIETVKEEIAAMLKDYFREEGIEMLSRPAVHNIDQSPLVMFEGIEGLPLEGSLLQWEIRVILGIMGKPWQCERLVQGIYRAFIVYKPTAIELTALLTSLQVEVTHFARARGVSKRTTIRYIVGHEKEPSEP